jgi:hypothetical protein
MLILVSVSSGHMLFPFMYFIFRASLESLFFLFHVIVVFHMFLGITACYAY